MDEPLVWIQMSPANTDKRLYCTEVKYKGVTFQWCYANVPHCTVKFQLKHEFLNKKPAWLVFDMGYDYNVYGPITVKGTSREGEEEDVSYPMDSLEIKQDLYDQRDLDGCASWGRIVPIRFSAAEKVDTIWVTFGFTFRASRASVDKCELSFVFPFLGRQDKLDVKMEGWKMVQDGETVDANPSNKFEKFDAENQEFSGRKRLRNGERLEITFAYDEKVMKNYFLKPVGVEANGIVAISYPFCKLDSKRSRSEMVHVMYVQGSKYVKIHYGAMSRLLGRITLSDEYTSSDVYLCNLVDRKLAFVKLQGSKMEDRMSQLHQWFENSLCDHVISDDERTRLLAREEVSFWIFCEGKRDETLAAVNEKWKKYIIHVGRNIDDQDQSDTQNEEGACVIPWRASISSDYQAILCQALQEPYMKPLKLETQVECDDFPTGYISFNEIAYNIFRNGSNAHEVTVQYETGPLTEEGEIALGRENVTIENKPEWADVLRRMFAHLDIIGKENQLTREKFSPDALKTVRDTNYTDWETCDCLSRFVELEYKKEGRGFCVKPLKGPNKFVLYQYAWWDTKDYIGYMANNIHNVMLLPDERQREQLTSYAYDDDRLRAGNPHILSSFSAEHPKEETAKWSDVKLEFKLLEYLPAYWLPWYEKTVSDLEEKLKKQDET